nr:penicillin acylase family protein [Arsenicicoccus piscis]
MASSQPGVWHQVGLHCTRVSSSCPFDVSGFTFAGVPGVVIGHNARVAWAFTNLDPDVADLYLERATDSTYLQDGTQHALSLRTERIAVAGGQEQTLVIRETKHGPIISDVLGEVSRAGQQAPVGGRRQNPGDPVPEVSLAWTALRPMRTADGLFALNTAGSFADFRAALKNFSAPSQNVLYADVDGHIGYQAPGDVPIRASATPGTPPGWLPAPGWDSAYDWQGYVPYEQLPWTYDPPEGLIVTANQQVTASSTPFLTTDWTPGWRSSRIRSLLLAQDKVSPDRMREIQLDDLDPLASTLVPMLRRIDLGNDDFTREGQALLEGYDGQATEGRSKAASAAAFYNVVVAHILRLALDDSLPDGAKVTGGGRYASILAGILQHPDSPWWDDRTTPSVERRDDILARAMVAARLDLTASAGKAVTRWDWGTLHAASLQHPLSAGLPGLVRDLFDRGPVPVPGNGVTVNAMGFDQTQGYATTHVPSMRMVVDLGALDSSTWVNLTGVSGHPLSRHYDDQTDAWATGRSFAWPSTPNAVQAATVDTLVLQPDGSGD